MQGQLWLCENVFDFFFFFIPSLAPVSVEGTGTFHSRADSISHRQMGSFWVGRKKIS